MLNIYQCFFVVSILFIDVIGKENLQNNNNHYQEIDHQWSSLFDNDECYRCICAVIYFVLFSFSRIKTIYY